MSTGLVAAEKVLRNVLNDESDKKESKIAPKDFYWDQIIFYLVSAILGLSFLEISVEFFRGSRVQCFTPTEIPIDRDHFAFLNNYCYGSLPASQYYLVFLLVAALFIIAPHYLWSGYFSKHFDYFFDIVKKLDRLHDPNTGEYDPLNFDYIKKLEERFSTSDQMKPKEKFSINDVMSIRNLYVVKLSLQLMLIIAAFIVNLLYFTESDFDANFTCNVDLNYTAWPYPMDIDCVYNSLRLLWFLRLAAFVLIVLVGLIAVYGIFWCCFQNHAAELGADHIARFCFDSCLLPDKHTILNLNTMIKTDLDFLLLKLCFADSGHGKVFRDIQINKELKIMFEQDHELLHLLLRTHADMLKQRIKNPNDPGLENYRIDDLKMSFFRAGYSDVQDVNNVEINIFQKVKGFMGIEDQDWRASPLRNVMYQFFRFAKKNNVALDIGFETKLGYSLILARAFNDVTTIYFDRYYRSTKVAALQRKYQPSYDVTTFPDNIFSQEASRITEADNMISDLFEDEGRKGINLIMVGPITDRPKIVSTNLLINKIYENRLIGPGAVLIAVRPLSIGGMMVGECFQQYKPPEGLFVRNCGVYKSLKLDFYEKMDKKRFVRVDPRNTRSEYSTPSRLLGVGVMCGDVKCIFEFCVYDYKGRLTSPAGEEDEYQSVSNNNSVFL